MASGTNNFNQKQNTTQLTVEMGNIDSGDISEPYNYLDWKKRVGIVRPDQLFETYNNYLRNWYNKRNIIRNIPTTHIVKQDYITLLKQLTLTFQSVDEQRFLENLDYDNDIDLAIAVPYFAKQLKQVATYLAGKRESVKATKLKYSMAGTSLAIEKILYQHLLTAFTKKKYVTRVYDNDFYSSLPQLSAVNKYLNIEVEPLYDESNYFDSDTSSPLSAYNDGSDLTFVSEFLTSSMVQNLANTRNYSSSAVDLKAKYLGVGQVSISANSAGIVAESSTLDPTAPYAHTSNRYFATVASIPNLTEIKSQSEIGGYFTYRSLGVSTYLAVTKAYEYDVSSMVPGVTYTIPDPLYINHGRGLTLNDQQSFVIHDINLDWVKSKDTNSHRDGFIANPKSVQKFIPYQSQFESVGIDAHGTTRVSDRFDFWIGDYGDIWSEQASYPLSWRGDFNIADRENVLQVTNKTLHNWATDIFGNHYSIYKDYSLANGLSSIGVYEKRDRVGEIWTRTTSNTVAPGPLALENIFKKYQTIDKTIFDTLSSNQIRNLDVVHNTMVLEIDNYVLLEQLNYDYTSGTILDAEGSSVISLGSNNNYGGFWFNESENTLTFCVLTASTSGSNALYYPTLYKTDHELTSIYQVFPVADTDLSPLIIPLSVTISSHERPVITYNKNTKTYNISFLTLDNTDVYLHTIDLLETNEYGCVITNTPTIHKLA